MNTQKHFKNFFPNNIFQFILVLITSLLICLPLLFIESLLEKMTFNIIIYITLFIAFTSIVLFINRKRGIKGIFNLHVSNYKLLIILVLSVFVFQIGINIPLTAFIPQVLNPEDTVQFPFDSLFFTFSAIILAPLIEETIFRGVLLKGLLQKNKPTKAILISALFFTVVHINPYQIIGAFYFGMLFGYVYNYTQSLGYTIILHASANILGLAGRYILYKAELIADINNYHYIGIYIIASSIILFLLLKKINTQRKISHFNGC